MANMHEQVKEFMIAMHQDMLEGEIGFCAETLRIRLILEEANEVAQAIYAHDLVKTVDGLCDSMYVILGTFIAMGFTSKQVGILFNEVHKSNMAKAGGKLDSFGKVQKPEGWSPPDIEGVLEEMVSEMNDYVAVGETGEITVYSSRTSKEQAEHFAENMRNTPGIKIVHIERLPK